MIKSEILITMGTRAGRSVLTNGKRPPSATLYTKGLGVCDAGKDLAARVTENLFATLSCSLSCLRLRGHNLPKGKKRLELGFAVKVVVKYREIRLTNGKREFVPRDQPFPLLSFTALIIATRKSVDSRLFYP